MFSQLALKPGVGQNIATHASPTSTFPVHSPSFVSKSSPYLVKTNTVAGVGPRNKIGHPAHCYKLYVFWRCCTHGIAHLRLVLCGTNTTVRPFHLLQFRGFTVCNIMRIYERERERESCLLYTSPSPRDQLSSRMPSSA